MENILDKINAAYKKGIEDSRYQKAIKELIINPEIEAAKAKEAASKNTKGVEIEL